MESCIRAIISKSEFDTGRKNGEDKDDSVDRQGDKLIKFILDACLM